MNKQENRFTLTNLPKKLHFILTGYALGMMVLVVIFTRENYPVTVPVINIVSVIPPISSKCFSDKSRLINTNKVGLF